MVERQYIADLNDGQQYINGSIPEFTKQWGWDRQTVVRFIEQLRSLDVLTVDTFDNRKAFKMKILSYVDEHP